MSIDPAINALHAAYCDTMNLPLRMNNVYERHWYEAHRQGMTPEDVRLCLEARLKSNHANNYKFGTLIRHIAGSDEDIANCLNEAAVVRASRRIKVMEPGKASVLKATHRPATVPQEDAKHVGELIEKLKRAAE